MLVVPAATGEIIDHRYLVAAGREAQRGRPAEVPVPAQNQDPHDRERVPNGATGPRDDLPKSAGSAGGPSSSIQPMALGRITSVAASRARTLPERHGGVAVLVVLALVVLIGFGLRLE